MFGLIMGIFILMTVGIGETSLIVLYFMGVIPDTTPISLVIHSVSMFSMIALGAGFIATGIRKLLDQH